MSTWLHRILSEPVSAPPAAPNNASSWPSTPLTPRTAAARLRDPNAPDYRYQVNQKCIYERRLPGGSYITAHVQRLQSGYYDSPVIHEDRIDNVRFVAVNFVFHPSSSTFRFKAAEIRIALHHMSGGEAEGQGEDGDGGGQGVEATSKTSHEHGTQTEAEKASQALVKGISSSSSRKGLPRPSRPKFLRHAPHLLYGSISPETLDWNFNLAGSLGVSQGPASASVKPSYGVKSSYKIYEMMKIQGSVRTLRSWRGSDYDYDHEIEDGELVWTLEENRLQKSGLPREFTFVMLLTKGSGGFEESGDVRLEIDVRPKVTGRLGPAYPSLVTKLHQYRPFKREVLDLDQEIGQVFEPHDAKGEGKGEGFNFANIASSFDDFVWLPGTAYSTSDAGAGSVPQTGTGFNASTMATQQQHQHQQGSQPHQQQLPRIQAQDSRPPPGDTTLNLRVFLEQSRGTPVPFSPSQLQLQLPYVNLKVPSPNPSRGPSPTLQPSASVTGSRRTITIGSGSSSTSRSRSVRKRRSRSELSKEYKASPQGMAAQQQQQQQQQSKRMDLGQVTFSQRPSQPAAAAVSTPARPFSYQEQKNDSKLDKDPEHHPDHADEDDSSDEADTPRALKFPSGELSSPQNPLLTPLRPSSPEYATPPAYPIHPPLLPLSGVPLDKDSIGTAST
ncbi:hypothetical protein AYO20_02557 [Fonsecaea nubica]|uniref:Uncharacterized protein n=1 Tax=Fonsecaea nubica TaxID=856822 RepID=A0A178DAG8_9EURO|nr:hypothetical protein AYO20_02557 [Fonsecaea nubica]OAL38105.1 hypothetical protein AYO20_02557 [Fonsecaea nubica]